jgi:hypothetical protein
MEVCKAEAASSFFCRATHQLDGYVCCDGEFVLVAYVFSGGFEAYGVDEIVEGLDDPLVELVKLR